MANKNNNKSFESIKKSMGIETYADSQFPSGTEISERIIHETGQKIKGERLARLQAKQASSSKSFLGRISSLLKGESPYGKAYVPQEGYGGEVEKYRREMLRRTAAGRMELEKEKLASRYEAAAMSKSIRKKPLYQVHKTLRYLFPMHQKVIPQPQRYYSAVSTGTKGTGKRGRPKGSYDPKYAAYGGVIAARKFKAQQNRIIRQIRAQIEGKQIALQRQMMRNPRAYAEYIRRQQIQQMRQMQLPQQYQPQQYHPQQVATQQQYQYPQEIPQQSFEQAKQQRPITTIFKSYGGSPYGSQPIVSAYALQTNPQGEWYETVDAFTGQRILKRRLPAEKWIRPY